MEDDNKKINPECFVCSNSKVVFFVQKNSCDLFKCQRCGLIFAYPIPTNLDEIYSEDYFCGAKQGAGYVDYDRDKAAMSATFEICLNKIEKILPNKGSLLDVGAATGTFLEAAKARGWTVGGIEISDYAAQKAREKGIDVKTGTLENLDITEGQYDAITMWDVIEHLPDPESALILVKRLLRPGGVLALNTPNAGSLYAKFMGKRWHLIVPPEHIFYFNAENLTKLLHKLGIEVHEATCLGKKFTIQYVLKTLSAWQKIRMWDWLANKVQGRALGRAKIYINLHDNLFIIAKG